MNASVIQAVILKDWRLHRAHILFSLAAGALALAVLQVRNETAFLLGTGKFDWKGFDPATHQASWLGQSHLPHVVDQPYMAWHESGNNADTNRRTASHRHARSDGGSPADADCFALGGDDAARLAVGRRPTALTRAHGQWGAAQRHRDAPAGAVKHDGRHRPRAILTVA